ncbi:MAG: ATP-binding protein [Oculatellaceae cyanobacterium bins.114]|nr:ATP-binding protein [Oculatellaceae cyanobacterium bins.114]
MSLVWLLNLIHRFEPLPAIFSDSMMTVAAVDRLVYHALIVEIHADSYRKQAAVAKGTNVTTAALKPQASA